MNIGWIKNIYIHSVIKYKTEHIIIRKSIIRKKLIRRIILVSM